MFLETIKSFITRHKEKRRTSEKDAAQFPHNSLQLTGMEAQDPLPALPLSSIATFNEDGTFNPQAQEPISQIQHASSADGFFANSEGLVFNQPTMISQVFNYGGGAIMQLLATKRISGAEVDSSARYPPPRCHPDTRQGLREQVTEWIVNPGRDSRMLYVLGPAGVGKSALAQTIAEDRKEAGCLGATCFLSRPNHRDDPDGVIPTLVHQLAVKHPIYKYIISQKLADDPTMLEKDRKSQFKELIIDPFRTIMAQHPSTVQDPFLIIIDGLDECKDEEAQCEFVELISDHVRSVPQFPLFWMICSRPEWHLRYLLTQPDFQVICKRVEISVDDDEAQRDVLVYLRDEFTKIRMQYRDSVDDDWPQESHIRQIAGAASGLFAFASTIVRFVSDANAGDPPKNLQTCINILGGSGVASPLNPYHALDLLYRQILLAIPSVIRATTMRILGTVLLYPPPPTSPWIRRQRPLENPTSPIIAPSSVSLQGSPSTVPLIPHIPLQAISPHPPSISPPPLSPISTTSTHDSSQFPSKMVEDSSDPYPATLSPTTLRMVLRFNWVSSAQMQANLLRISRSTFYHALKQLYSVLRIPSSSEASKDSVTFYHASFGDFLRDQMRSGEFCIDAAKVHYDVAINLLRWHTDPVEKQEEDLSWVPSHETRQTCLEAIQSHSLSIVWAACAQVDGPNASVLVEKLLQFDFNTIDYIRDERAFVEFLVWLYSLRHCSSAAKLIHVPEECIQCDAIESTVIRLHEPPTTLLAQQLGLNALNHAPHEIHCYIGDESRRRHVRIAVQYPPVIPFIPTSPRVDSLNSLEAESAGNEW